MRALVSTPDGREPGEIREVAEPQPQPGDAVIEVKSISLNRGELRQLAAYADWVPGQDVAGVVLRAGRGRERTAGGESGGGPGRRGRLGGAGGRADDQDRRAAAQRAVRRGGDARGRRDDGLAGAPGGRIAAERAGVGDGSLRRGGPVRRPARGAGWRRDDGRGGGAGARARTGRAGRGARGAGGRGAGGPVRPGHGGGRRAVPGALGARPGAGRDRGALRRRRAASLRSSRWGTSPAVPALGCRGFSCSRRVRRPSAGTWPTWPG